MNRQLDSLDVGREQAVRGSGSGFDESVAGTAHSLFTAYT